MEKSFNYSVIQVKSKISGIVRRSYREVGDYVRAGDPLFEISPDPTPLELTEARREVENATNAWDQAKRRYDRQDALKKQGITSSHFLRGDDTKVFSDPAVKKEIDEMGIQIISWQQLRDGVARRPEQ